jgi:hypothetical protein
VISLLIERENKVIIEESIIKKIAMSSMNFGIDRKSRIIIFQKLI